MIPWPHQYHCTICNANGGNLKKWRWLIFAEWSSLLPGGVMEAVLVLPSFSRFTFFGIGSLPWRARRQKKIQKRHWVRLLKPFEKFCFSPLPFRLPTWCSSREFTCQYRRHSSIPGSGRYPGEGNGNPLQYFCLENPLDRWAWQTTVHRLPNSPMQLKRMSMYTCRRYKIL